MSASRAYTQAKKAEKIDNIAPLVMSAKERTKPHERTHPASIAPARA